MARGKRYATAIDLGHAQVKVVTLSRRANGPLELVRATRAEVPRPVAGQNVEDLASRQAAALREALKQHGRLDGTLVSALPRHLVAARRLVLPSVQRDEIADMAAIEAERQMPFPPGEAEVSFQVIDQVGDTESHLTLVGAAQRDLAAHMDVLEAAGQEPDVIDVSTLGAGGAYLSLVGDGETVAVLNLGRTATEVSILRGGHVVESRGSFWGEQKLLTAAAPAPVARPEDEVDPHRIELDEPAAAPVSSQGLSAWAEQLARELRRIFTAFQHEAYGSPIHRIIFCGGLAHNAQAVARLAAELGLPARVEPVPTALFTVADPAKAPGPEFAVAVGLALRGLFYAPGCINLIPRKTVEEHARRHRKRFLSNVACLSLALLFLAGASVYVKWVRLDAYRARLQAELDGWSKDIELIKTSDSIFRELNDRLDKDHPAIAVVLDVLERVPRPSTVISIDFKKRDVVVVKGLTHSDVEVGEVVRALKESPHFRREGVVPGPTQNKSGPAIHLPIWQFEIRCELASSGRRDERRRAAGPAAERDDRQGRPFRG